MKKNIGILIMMLTIGYNLSGQVYIDGKELRKEETKYFEIDFFGVVGSNDVKMFIDFGQDVAFLDRKSRIVSDRRGKALIFNSPVHGLNWLYSNGWKLKHVYNPNSGGTTVNSDIKYLIERIEEQPAPPSDQD